MKEQRDVLQHKQTELCAAQRKNGVMTQKNALHRKNKKCCIAKRKSSATRCKTQSTLL